MTNPFTDNFFDFDGFKFPVTQEEIFFLQSKKPIKKTISVNNVVYPLEYSIRPVLVNKVKSICIEILPPANYPQTPVTRTYKCFSRVYITFFSHQLYIYRFNNYISKYYGLATEDEEKISKKLGIKTLKFAIRWITKNIGHWEKISFKMTSNTRLIDYFCQNNFQVSRMMEGDCVEMSAYTIVFL